MKLDGLTIATLETMGTSYENAFDRVPNAFEAFVPLQPTVMTIA
jgi:hypothetical protein